MKIIFDLGGVIIESAFEPFSKEIEALYNVDKNKVYKLLHELQNPYFSGRINEKEFWKTFSKKLNIKNDWKKFKTIMFSFYHLNPEVFKLIKKLKRRKYKLALLTNVSKEWLWFTLKKYPFTKIFDAIVASYMYKSGKPSMSKFKEENKLYHIVVEKLKTYPNECIFIDNKKPNIIPAKKLGMKTILFKNSKQLEDNLKKLGIRW